MDVLFYSWFKSNVSLCFLLGWVFESFINYFISCKENVKSGISFNLNQEKFILTSIFCFCDDLDSHFWSVFCRCDVYRCCDGSYPYDGVCLCHDRDLYCFSMDYCWKIDEKGKLAGCWNSKKLLIAVRVTN